MATATYKPIATTTLASNASSYTFSSIPQTYTDLVLVCNVTNTASGYFGGKINADSGSNYSDTIVWGATNAESFRYTGTSSSRFGYSTTANSSKKTVIVNFMNYSNTATYKVMATEAGDTGAAGAAISLYRSTSAITSIEVFFSDGASIASGSTFTLYGIL